ncbi:glycoside hydrolase family 32 protein [Paenibacillus ginsengihumi]|uniref:glycoside hydrolase family 32 protein n=1 Tax=Paenibacillus ginsengihumi TaxID=431596 RepID=UPI000375B909|nr:glycoside hydrolase family 32 protein [Paenibacillus ginsengihumi]
MKDHHQERIAAAERSLQNVRERVASDPWRPRYHVAPPAYWMNDPNGFCYYRGEYHLFYQHHPYSPLWDDMHWGHAVSRDLVRWRQLPIALAPGETYDRDGCFSGSAIEKDGKLHLLYTGNIWTGDNRDTDLKQSQCLAISEDGVRFDKWAGNPVIAEAPEGDIHPFHFRDPKVWRHEGAYYAVLGSRTKDHKGQVLLYRSDDLLRWQFVSVMAGGREGYGYMWECPDLFSLDGRDVLVLSPQGMKPDGDKYLNLHQAGYLEGRLDYETGKFEHGGFTMLDYGFDFYAPQTLLDERGRRIMIAWMAMWESEMPEQERQWAGAMTLPRELRYERGRLITLPVAEMALLRTNPVSLDQVTIEGEAELPGVSGDCFELELLLDIREARSAGVKLCVNEASGEETTLIYDRESGMLTLDRERSGQGPGGVRRAPVEVADGGLLRLRLFVDRSSVEVFAQDGEIAMTARIYPGAESTGIRFMADGRMRIVALRKWDLDRSVGLEESADPAAAGGEL